MNYVKNLMNLGVFSKIEKNTVFKSIFKENRKIHIKIHKNPKKSFIFQKNTKVYIKHNTPSFNGY